MSKTKHRELAAHVNPRMPEAVALHESGRLEEAAKIYLEISAEDPQDFDATHLLGVAALQQGRFDVAQRLIHKAILINPNDASAMGNLGSSYMRNGQLQAALLWFDMAVKLQPDSPIALFNVATALHSVGRERDAIPYLRNAHAADPDSYPVNNLLGVCLLKTGEPHEAAELLKSATRSHPEHAEGWANLSVALTAIGRRADARDSADKAVAIMPDSSMALGALGAAQLEEGRLAEAVDSYRQGAALPAPSTQMLLLFSSALLASGLNEEAMEQLKRVVEIDPNNLSARWAMVISNLRPIYQLPSQISASREAFATAMDDIDQWYQANTVPIPFHAVGACQPFYLAYQPFNNRALLSHYGALCVRWMATMPTACDAPRITAQKAPHTRDRRLRVGIASAHISQHSVWNAITKGWVYNIDQTRFELFLFQLNPASDEETTKARKIVAQFEERPSDLAGWVETIKQKELDVLIYPEIGMHPMTSQLAALRLAPVQATTWGHPETSGLPTMDLYISAASLEPADSSHNYSERLVTLPNLGVYVEPLEPVEVKVNLRLLNLPSGEPLLLCPGSPFKYSPLHDEVWIAIAKQLKRRIFKTNSGGRLVFFRSRSDVMDKSLENRLRAAFDKANVEFDAHVSILPVLDRSRYFGLMRKSALLLDTLGFSGFNTALQAIECGLPVLTYEGEFMRGRLASGIMQQLNLPELVAKSADEFVQKAVELAGDSRRRKRLRHALSERRGTLFRDVSPIRALENHLTDAVARARAISSSDI